ncbi:MAG: hypothetical protein H7343_08645 [Undibacterium sp.]|nr:hypothetical protein [Opitutaceae bacterium]
MEERAVVLREMADADAETALLNVGGDVVAAFFHALTDAGARDFQVGNPEKIEADAVAGGAEIGEQRNVAVAGERSLEDKIFPTRGEVAEAAERDAAGFEGGAVGVEQGESGGDEISVYEFKATHLLP